MFFLVDDFYYLLGSSVFRAGSFFVFVKSSLNVSCYSRIDAFIGAECHIYEPSHIDRIAIKCYFIGSSSKRR